MEMSDIERIYHDLEKALNEFFDQSTTNQRKQEIDQALKAFQKDNRAIPYSLSFLEHSNQQYVLMYSLHILQTAIETLWLQLENETKTQIKDALIRIIPQFFRSQPPFLSNKILKVFALVGRLEWLSTFPNFFDHIFVHISDNTNQLLGLKMLQVTIEEFQNVTDCALLSFDQKEALKSNLKDQMETILNVLLKLVENLKLFYRSAINESSSESFFYSIKRYCAHSSNIPQIPNEVHSICSIVLTNLAVIYQTVDLFIIFKSPQLLDFVFGLCFTGVRCVSTSSDTDIEVLALNCVIELAGRNYPTNFHVEQLKLFEFLYFLIRELNTLEDVAGHDLKSKLARLNEVWLKKVVELIRLFFVHHIHRYDSSDKWPSVDLLQQFLTLTDNFGTLELFMQSLDAWNLFLDYLSAKLDCNNDDERSKSLQYESLFEIAVSVLLNKMHASNSSSLFDASEVEFGEDFETSQWGQYIIACCDVLAKIADFHPLTVFHALKSSFDAKLNAYLNMTDPKKMVSVNSNEMVAFFQDFQSVLKGLGRLAHLFINENFWKFNSEARDFVEKLCQAIVFSSRTKMYLLDENVGNRVKAESTNLFAQFLLSIRSYCHWLAQFYADAQRTGENNEIVSAIITSNVDCIVPLLNLSNPTILVSAAVSTLYSILITVRPQMYLLNMESARLLYDEANKLTFLRFSPEIYKVLYGSLVNYLILPWYNAVDCEQEWSVRKPLYQKLMKVLLSDYINFCNVDAQHFAETRSDKNCINVTIPIVLEMLDSIANENSTTKKFCYSALKPVASGTLRLLQSFGGRPDILEKLLSLISSMFATLVVQLGVDFTKETVQILLQMTSSQNLVDLLKSETSTTCKVLELVLKILHCIVKEMAKSYQQFTPSVIHLLLENVKPVIVQTPSIDLKTTFYDVLHSVLFIKWRYFFPVSILASMENQSLGDKTEHAEELLTLLQTFGESLLLYEPSIIKQNLAYLDNLNVKWNLYRRAIFTKNLYPNFTQTLLSMVVNRTHSILNEDFYETLAQMTCCCDESLNLFRSQLLEQFLSSLDDLRSDQKNELMCKFRLEKDVPSFSLSLQKFCNDIIMFRMSNRC